MSYSSQSRNPKHDPRHDVLDHKQYRSRDNGHEQRCSLHGLSERLTTKHLHSHRWSIPLPWNANHTLVPDWVPSELTIFRSRLRFNFFSRLRYDFLWRFGPIQYKSKMSKAKWQPQEANDSYWHWIVQWNRDQDRYRKWEAKGWIGRGWVQSTGITRVLGIQVLTEGGLRD